MTVGSSVVFDGFPLTGLTPAGGRATVVGSDGLTGWFDKSLRRDRQSRSQQAGAWASRGLPDARSLGLRVRVVYADAAKAAAERREMLTLGGRDTAELTVEDALGVGTRMVETDSISVVIVRDTMIELSLAVTACDPLLYGPAWWDSTTLASAVAGTGRVWPREWPRDWGIPEGVTPGAVTVPNAGTAPYWPVLRLDGPVTNAVIRCVETGDSLKVNTSITSGFFDLDCGERHFTFGANADDIRGLVDVTGTALAIPPGGATLTLEADSGTSDTTLTVNGYESAWD